VCDSVCMLVSSDVHLDVGQIELDGLPCHVGRQTRLWHGMIDYVES
jgi:hypothetical protein